MANPELLLGGVGAGLGALGNIYSTERNVKMVRETNRQQERLFHEANKYNSVGQQMKRAIEAGVHPMLMAGAQPSDAASVPDLQAPESRNPFESFPSVGVNLGAQVLQDKQIALQEQNLKVEEARTMVEALSTMGELIGRDLTFNEVKTLFQNSGSYFKNFGGDLTELAVDQKIMTHLRNGIESSNLDLEEKKYLFGWLDEMTNAEYMMKLAGIEQAQTQSMKLRSDISVNETIKAVNRQAVNLSKAQEDEVRQAISNMQEQWKSLNYQGELDGRKMKTIRHDASALSQKLQAEAKLSKYEADYYIWTNLSNYNPYRSGKPFKDEDYPLPFLNL